MGSFEHGDLVGGFDCFSIMVVLQSNMGIFSGCLYQCLSTELSYSYTPIGLHRCVSREICCPLLSLAKFCQCQEFFFDIFLAVIGHYPLLSNLQCEFRMLDLNDFGMGMSPIRSS